MRPVRRAGGPSQGWRYLLNGPAGLLAGWLPSGGHCCQLLLSSTSSRTSRPHNPLCLDPLLSAGQLFLRCAKPDRRHPGAEAAAAPGAAPAVRPSGHRPARQERRRRQLPHRGAGPLPRALQPCRALPRRALDCRRGPTRAVRIACQTWQSRKPPLAQHGTAQHSTACSRSRCGGTLLPCQAPPPADDDPLCPLLPALCSPLPLLQWWETPRLSSFRTSRPALPGAACRSTWAAAMAWWSKRWMWVSAPRWQRRQPPASSSPCLLAALRRRAAWMGLLAVVPPQPPAACRVPASHHTPARLHCL